MAAGRRTSLASMAGQRVETVPGQSDPILVRLTPAKVVPTPLNPRTNFGTDEELAELGESMRKRQLQPVVVVGRTSYLRLFPEHTEQVGAASHVIANGERRYRAARHVGLDGLNALILEEVAASREDFLDAVFSENIDRKNFDPIEEALAVQAMVKECGKAATAAERFRRTGGWVSQRLALLRLAPEVQILVRSGQMPVREARELASQPADEQLRVWKDRQREKTEQREAKKAATPVADSGRTAAAAVAPAVPAPLAGTTGQGREEPAPAASADRGPWPAAPATTVVPAAAVVPPQGGNAAAGPAPAPVSTARPGHPGEPDWVGEERMAAVVGLGRELVERLSLFERSRLTVYLLSVGEEEKKRRTASNPTPT